MAVTLILTRKPLNPFKRDLGGGRWQSGRWGELVALKGPKVISVVLTPAGGGSPAKGDGAIQVDAGVLQLSTTGGAITDEKHFTSMERYHGDSGGKIDYIYLRPKPTPYLVTYEPQNSVVKGLRPKDPTFQGACFRVHGGQGREQAILIHEAPSVGWVIGCISPRPLHDYRIENSNDKSDHSYKAMQELFTFTNKASADLFVLD